MIGVRPNSGGKAEQVADGIGKPPVPRRADGNAPGVIAAFIARYGKQAGIDVEVTAETVGLADVAEFD